jgi:hypothetical protein
MKLHRNAALNWHGRRRLVDGPRARRPCSSLRGSWTRGHHATVIERQRLGGCALELGEESVPHWRRARIRDRACSVDEPSRAVTDAVPGEAAGRPTIDDGQYDGRARARPQPDIR